jgi:CheY-like chemotaxis protein
MAPSRRILVVDDNTDGAEMLAAMLALQSHDTRIAAETLDARDVCLGLAAQCGVRFGADAGGGAQSMRLAREHECDGAGSEFEHRPAAARKPEGAVDHGVDEYRVG